ncbi:TrmB family transcriptional regulator [Fimbriimonas ginsengisoli]|uniref:Transcriptional regulator, TrmB n=1 Tax=Fimbriimonas ginsengisoli Gsoil 348 TaxID=661478 RepID=A0A068NMM7_FIMGI|nr:helix-turn-helix domain-containing protein [Fimbriimonas ginsengisoli]AIE84015.1 transcriptional regulator, TrmB [Fimbriimonas ginsengisoli Gsoil 348]
MDAVSALTPFGFTGLEAEIYSFLLTESPATGYRIAQGLGKPVANTYKAIQTLQAKGAIVVEEGESRLCRAVPSDELLDRLAKEYDARRIAAKQFLAGLGSPEHDQRIYFIRAYLQAMHRLRTMLGEAEEIALLSAKSSVVQALADDLAAAVARGVEVFVKTDAVVTIPRVETMVSSREDDLLRTVSIVRLVVDGEQHLVGALSEASTEAIWSRHPALSLSQHEGLAAELTLLEIAERLEDGAGPKRLTRALSTVKPASKTPGAKNV